jgi:predicted ATPase
VILRSARVRKYKSVDDSGTIKFEEKVTSLVGKNEAGKTALMEALYRLNPTAAGYQQDFRALYDYPRATYSADKQTAPKVVPITATFELEPSDVEAVEGQFGKGVLTSTEIEFSKDYEGTRFLTVRTHETAAVKHFARTVGIDESAVAGDDLAKFKARLENVPPSDDAAKAQQVAQLVTNLATLDLGKEIRIILASRLPKFVYFDEYSTLLGRASIARLQQVAEGQLKPSERTALSLVRLAGAETAEFVAAEYEARKASLEAAANQVSDEVFRYWSQNKDLSVQLDVDFKTTQDPAGDPPYLEVRINNRRHRVTLNVGERSAGFIFFFSFVAAFSEYRGRGDRVIMLLDEPALGLHAEAQRDLLRYIDERLAPRHQVIYSTHSPFMIKADELQRVRTVEDLDDKGTTVSADIFLARKETINPIQGALGYDLAQTLFIGPDNLVVEGASDYLYLQVMSGHLRTLKRTHLDPRWVIVPVAGLEKIPTFVALLGSQLRVAVLVDSAGGGSQRLASMVDRHLLEPNRLLPVTSITGTKEADIEDMFDSNFYLDLLKASGAAKVTASQLKGGDRITKKIERAIGKAYDHYDPARYLLENQISLLPKVDSATLDRFEELFKRLNALLPKP